MSQDDVRARLDRHDISQTILKLLFDAFAAAGIAWLVYLLWLAGWSGP